MLIDLKEVLLTSEEFKDEIPSLEDYEAKKAELLVNIEILSRFRVHRLSKQSSLGTFYSDDVLIPLNFVKTSKKIAFDYHEGASLSATLCLEEVITESKRPFPVGNSSSISFTIYRDGRDYSMPPRVLVDISRSSSLGLKLAIMTPIVWRLQNNYDAVINSLDDFVYMDDDLYKETSKILVDASNKVKDIDNQIRVMESLMPKKDENN
jgi:hypothetical protein